MSIFSLEQYDMAIEALQLARQQHTDNTTSKGCSICGGGCLPDTYGHNPLYAMHCCEQLVKQATALHESLHTLAGINTYMGESTGPARVSLPVPEKIKQECDICERTDEHRHCPECGDTGHTASHCDMLG